MESCGSRRSCVCSRRWGEEWAPRPADRGSFLLHSRRCGAWRGAWRSASGAAPAFPRRIATLFSGGARYLDALLRGGSA